METLYPQPHNPPPAFHVRDPPEDTGGRDTAASGERWLSCDGEGCATTEPAHTNRGAPPAASPRFPLPTKPSLRNSIRETHPGEVPVRIIAQKRAARGRQAAALAPARSSRRAHTARRGRIRTRGASLLTALRPPPGRPRPRQPRETSKSGMPRSAPSTRLLSGGPGTGDTPARRDCAGAIGAPLLPLPAGACRAPLAWGEPSCPSLLLSPHSLLPRLSSTSYLRRPGDSTRTHGEGGVMEEPEPRPPPPPPDASSPPAASSATVWRAAGREGGALACAHPHSRRTDARPRPPSRPHLQTGKRVSPIRGLERCWDAAFSSQSVLCQARARCPERSRRAGNGAAVWGVIKEEGFPPRL